MKKSLKATLSVLLVVAMIVCAVLPAYAAKEEEYLSELRLVYASDYDEAMDILADSEFSDYYLLDENLNADTEKIGVWLAYKTTTNIEDAITDISIMQEEGGYSIGNYQAMLEKSRVEYREMGEIYLKAVDYFREAYDAGDFLAESAYRQLNLYTVKTVGISEIPSFEEELLGDIFYNGIGSGDLATMFMEGNHYALDSIRSLLAMGVAYNEDGVNYLGKVKAAAAAMTANPNVYSGEDFDDLITGISSTVLTFRDMFKELALYEKEFDYTDEDMTDMELRYAEHYSIAERFREVPYLGGKTLYEFCLAYELDEEDFSPLYPLAAALNEGQQALTRVFHYYDVVRYSMTDLPEDKMDEQIAKLEETYSENPFNIYEGVDRTIFNGNYAMTTEALRANASTSDGFVSWLLDSQPISGIGNALVGGTGTILTVWAICRSVKVGLAESAANRALDLAQAKLDTALNTAINDVSTGAFSEATGYHYMSDVTTSINVNSMSCNDVVNSMYTHYLGSDPASSLGLMDKIGAINAKGGISPFDKTALKDIMDKVADTTTNAGLAPSQGVATAKAKVAQVADMANSMSATTATLYALGGAMMITSAFLLGIQLACYYNPTYAKVPSALVDMIDTKDGDRYIKYDAVMETEMRDEGYIPGDLNAYAGQHWNAMYYTKSYEAGKPLLADEFKVSSRNNKPSEGYMPVHRFGEEVCYDLNKYAFHDDTSIYLSVKQSENQKYAQAGVPEVVGSVFGTGFLVLAGGIGAIAGIGGTLATQVTIKKMKAKEAASASASEETSEP